MNRRPILKLTVLTMLSGFCAAAVLAAPKPIYDVTGTWTGSSRSAKKGHATSTVSGMFATTSSANSAFTGTLSLTKGTATQDFTIAGTVSRSGTLKATLRPSETAPETTTITGTVHPKTNTITGTYKTKSQTATDNDHGTFTITKQPA